MPDIVVYVYNPSYWETEVGNHVSKPFQTKKIVKACLKKSQAFWFKSTILYMEVYIGGFKSKADPGKRYETLPTK
jgi:hypothetical protein